MIILLHRLRHHWGKILRILLISSIVSGLGIFLFEFLFPIHPVWSRAILYVFLISVVLVLLAVFEVNAAVRNSWLGALPDISPNSEQDLLNPNHYMIQNAPDPIVTLDLFGYLQFMNHAAEKAVGYTQAELKGKHVSKMGLVVGRYLAQAEWEIGAIMAGKTFPPSEYELIHRNGSTVPFEAHTSPLFFKGQLIGMQVIFRDLTYSRLNQSKIEESQKLYRRLVENLSPEFFFYSHDTNGIFTYLSPTIQKILGYNVDQFKDHYTAYLTKNPINERVIEHTNKSLEGIPQPRYEVELYDSKGGIHLLEVNEVPVPDDSGRVIGVDGLAHDITQRRAAEEQAKVLEEAVTQNPSATYITDADGVFLYVNPKFTEITGYSMEDVQGKTPRILNSGVQSPAFYKNLWKTILSGKMWRQELQNQRKDGSMYWAIATISPIRNNQGRTTHFVAVQEDITYQKSMDEIIKKEQEKIKTVISNMPGPVYRIEGKTLNEFSYLSNQINTLTGFPVIYFIKNGTLAYLNLIYPEDRQNYIDTFEIGIRSNQSFRMEYRIEDKKGNIHWVLENAQATLDPQGVVQFVDGVIFDVTDKKDLEDQVLQSQKMEAVGRLAGGIAHDFNNLLTIINGTAHLSMGTLSPEDQLHMDLNEILEAGRRAENLTRQLLAFSRRQTFDLVPLDINEVILGLEKMIRRLVPENITMSFDYLNHPLVSKIDPIQLEQVLINLILNAKDAIPRNGQIKIKTGRKKVEKKGIIEEYAVLSVKDNGVGIPESVKEKIFDPFFTTKPREKGTGLGLSTCFGIISKLKGKIEVRTKEKAGTTVRIYLPLNYERSVPVEKENIPSRLPVAVKGAVILVEDEPAVRKFAVRALRERGFQVIDAMDGDDALEKIQTHYENIVLLVTDVIMPRMGGRDLAERVKLKNPKIKILFISGYTDQEIDRDGVLEDSVHFLRKPFSSERLMSSVLEALSK